LFKLGLSDEAEASYRRALQLAPNFVDALNNLGDLLLARRSFDEAIDSFQRAIATKPGDAARAHWSLALALLLAGDYARGFEEFEWRWVRTYLREQRRTFDKPAWDGSPLAGKRILVHAEQGYGDLIQFARFVPFVPFARGGHAILECQPALAE